MTHEDKITEADLHAYVDGDLKPDQRVLVEKYLDANPAMRTKVDGWLEQKNVLHASFDHILHEPLPPGMQVKQTTRDPGRYFRHAFAAMMYLSIGIIVGNFVSPDELKVRHAENKSAYITQAFAAHAVYTPEVMHPVEVGVDQQDHLVKWLTKRLETPLRTPQLSQYGYQLIGGRLLPASTNPAAQLMYESSTGDRLTLYIRRASQSQNDTAFQFAQRNGVSLFYWMDEQVGYVLAADAPRERLLDLATTIYRQLLE